ncbi:TetR/AcrR family transcriptional regulator [Oceanobacillus neutriphilus]|uniref:TetR family transcriptional regulator n=1 Tax=Oceanobacillus neutriphilus TaxID=531815 RepID=A0ABQ2P0J7_9BACI|nr:TetR/AcrR family transcriptional regulator [Oceanobacillus neutriphilus]GGP15016.1 TetR family transcriptional regulator [Oceanobacillus neutriphilus]
MAPRISEEAKKARRDHLLEAALECFSSKGYYASTVDDIVRYANLSKGSVYNYFSSKEDIFIHLLEKKRTESMEHLKEKLDKIDSPTTKLQHWIHEDIPYSLEKKKFMRVHIEFWLYSADSPKLKEILSKRFDAMVDMTKAIIAEGKKRGEFRQDLDVEQATAMFWSLHDGIWLHAVIGYDVKKLESHIREMENVFITYIQ